MRRAAVAAAASRIAFKPRSARRVTQTRPAEFLAKLRDPRGRAALLKLPMREEMLELPLAHRFIVQLLVSQMAIRGGTWSVGVHELAGMTGCAPGTAGAALKAGVAIGVLRRTQLTQARAPGKYIYSCGPVLIELIDASISRAQRMSNGDTLIPFNEVNLGEKPRRNRPRGAGPKASNTGTTGPPTESQALLLSELRKAATGGGRDSRGDLPTFKWLVRRLPDDQAAAWGPLIVEVTRWAAPRQDVAVLGAFVRAQVVDAMQRAGVQLHPELAAIAGRESAHRHRCPPVRELEAQRSPAPQPADRDRSAAAVPTAIVPPASIDAAAAEFLQQLRSYENNPTSIELEMRREELARSAAAREQQRKKRRE